MPALLLARINPVDAGRPAAIALIGASVDVELPLESFAVVANAYRRTPPRVVVRDHARGQSAIGRANAEVTPFAGAIEDMLGCRGIAHGRAIDGVLRSQRMVLRAAS